MIFGFENLDVWREAMDFAKRLYEATEGFPTTEQFGLTSQLRRASISISTNIAEGKGRFHKKEFVQFLYISRGSLYETITLIKLAQGLRFFGQDVHDELVKKAELILSKLSGLINSLKVGPNNRLEPRAFNLEHKE
jgi:four helix bundle protein